MLDLFLYRKTVWLTAQTNRTSNWNLPMNSLSGTSDFIIYQNAETHVDFIIRDVDRRPVNLLNKKLLVTIINPYNNEALLQRELFILDPINGKVELVFLGSDSLNWIPGFYTYSILISEGHRSQSLLYTDQNSSSVGQFELRSGALPTTSISYEITRRDWMPYNPEFNNLGATLWRSSAFPGNLQSSAANALHTVAIYPRKFHGYVKIQGSLEQSPNLEEDWFDINLSNIHRAIYFDGDDRDDRKVEAFNFFVNVEWVRFVYHNSPIDTLYHSYHKKGRAPEKILYKNGGFTQPMKIIHRKIPAELHGIRGQFIEPVLDNNFNVPYWFDSYSEDESDLE